MAIVTILTDFGTADGYVGEMKGVILTRAPDCVPVDVTHEIRPGDVPAAAWALGRVWSRFPPGSIHLVVVDPGVGGPRRAVAVHAGERWFVGPDNGLLTRVLESAEAGVARRLDPSGFTDGPISATFHGRDLFAPAVAWLAAGRDAASLGPAIEAGSLVRLDGGGPERVGSAIRGRVVHIDRFGNLVTDIPGTWLAPTSLIEVGGQLVSGLKASYVGAPRDGLLALVGSGGTLEVSVRDGSAAERLGARRGDPVSVRPERD